MSVSPLSTGIGPFSLRPAEAPRLTGRDLARKVAADILAAREVDWPAALDLAVVEGFCLGIGADAVAERAGRSRQDVIARFRRLLPDPTPDSQRLAMTILRTTQDVGDGA